MTDKDDKWFLKRMEDLARTADRDGYCVCSDFLTEHQRELMLGLEPSLPVSVYYTGGYEDAERVVAVFCPAGLVSDVESYEELAAQELGFLRIRLSDSRFLKRDIGHRDYLGALMGCGIQREKLGDIGLEEGGAWVWVKQEMVEYLCKTMTSVGAALCRVECAQWNDAIRQEDKVESVISVSSMRLDSVISHGFHMSRGMAAEFIRAGKVYRNGSPVQQVDQSVRVGDSLTLRGKGKLRLLEERGRSRSDRIQLRIERLGKG